MATDTASAQADFLERLQRLDASAAGLADAAIPPLLIATSDPAALLQVLKARQALSHAAHATTLSADALRRDQKFAPPGRPSLHIVQLRQQQAAAQQATRRAKQDFAQAAAGFARSAGLSPPTRLSLSEFLQRWIDRYVR
jgi:hypothetical protein